MTDNPFTKRYQKLDNSELLDILDFPENFQPLAVEAARIEIESRNLTTEQLAEAKANQARRLEESKANDKDVMQVMGDQLKSFSSSITDALNPIQPEATQTTDKQIKLLTFFLAGLFLYQLYKEFSFLIFMFRDGSAEWDISTLVYVVPFLLLPLTTILFWLRKKLGWMLAMIFFSYSAAGAIPLLLSRYEPSGPPALDDIFPVPSPLYFFSALVIYSGVAVTLCRDNIKRAYKVDRKDVFTAVAIGVGIILLVNFIL